MLLTTKPSPTPARPTVPILDLSAQFGKVGDEVWRELREVAESTCYVLGPKVAAFERAFAAHVGVKHCVGVNSGTSALHLALICAGVKPGDEVITVPMTFIATSWAISYAGATPVYVDVDPVTYTMDPEQVERAITPRTRALLPVHLYGQPADLRALQDISNRHGIPLIEDAAQAHGARYRGQPAGSFGLCGCFSFYPGKNLGGYGEGGAVVTNDDRIASRLRSLRDHAQQQRYHHDEIGFNYRMDAFQGAVLGVKLRYLERWTEARRFLAERYAKGLAGLPLQLPVEAVGRQHVWHLYVVLARERDRLRTELEARSVQTGLHYPIPLHLQRAYAHLSYARGEFPVAERIGSECLTLPLFPEMTIWQQDAVIEALSDVLQETARR
ncbi:MAG TPA: DegT/DnrJ/EryC1/StrS family aminotransferase [Gemmataceae bacterium]|nr:DegT/DnrJ/EryC1/StrS family aminotransferase [Gemmataceae bacterium]